MITNVLPLFHILRVHYEWEMDCFILQGRVSTSFRWGGHIFSRMSVTFLSAYSSAKIIKIECVFPELWSQMYCHVFFGPQCIGYYTINSLQVNSWINQFSVGFKIQLGTKIVLETFFPANHFHWYMYWRNWIYHNKTKLASVNLPRDNIT